MANQIESKYTYNLFFLQTIAKLNCLYGAHHSLINHHATQPLTTSHCPAHTLLCCGATKKSKRNIFQLHILINVRTPRRSFFFSVDVTDHYKPLLFLHSLRRYFSTAQDFIVYTGLTFLPLFYDCVHGFICMESCPGE